MSQTAIHAMVDHLGIAITCHGAECYSACVTIRNNWEVLAYGASSTDQDTPRLAFKSAYRSARQTLKLIEYRRRAK